MDLRIGLEFLALRFHGVCSRSTASIVLVDPLINLSIINSFIARSALYPSAPCARTCKDLQPRHPTSPASRKSLDSFLVSISAAIHSVSYTRVTTES